MEFVVNKLEFHQVKQKLLFRVIVVKLSNGFASSLLCFIFFFRFVLQVLKEIKWSDIFNCTLVRENVFGCQRIFSFYQDYWFSNLLGYAALFYLRFPKLLCEVKLTKPCLNLV